VMVAHATARSRMLARIVDGSAVTLVDHGRLDLATCRRHMISQAELEGALRQEGLNGEQELDNVKLMMLESSGKISVVKQYPCRPDPA
jgi:uncharacterized membrane protein YcaP (DUF421 family)